MLSLDRTPLAQSILLSNTGKISLWTVFRYFFIWKTDVHSPPNSQISKIPNSKILYLLIPKLLTFSRHVIYSLFYLFVFRVNRALTKGFEDDVGVRTSFYCFTPWTLSNSLKRSRFPSPPGNDGIRYIFFAEEVWAYEVLAAYMQDKEPPLRTGKRYR